MKENIFTEPIKRYLENLKGHEVHINPIWSPWQINTAYTMHEDVDDDSGKYDWVISYLSPTILPQKTLDLAIKGAINFHPGPPEYPGIGCYNFAIWDEATHYGVTCHYMLEKVDTGKIIDTIYFPMDPKGSVFDLQVKTMAHLQIQFFEIMTWILKGEELPSDGEKWKRIPYKRVDLQKLCEIDVYDFFFGSEYEYDTIDVKRRLRATYYPGAKDKPYIIIDNKKWSLQPCD